MSRPLSLASALLMLAPLFAGCTSSDKPDPVEPGDDTAVDTDDTAVDTDDTAVDTDDTGTAEPTCTDGLSNGLETDEDCGGPDCAPCVRHQQCVEDSDCADTTCFEGSCERAMIFEGIGSAEKAIVGDWVSSGAIRMDFALPPTVSDFDGTPYTLPVSDGPFVSGDVCEAFEGAWIRVAGVELSNATGYTYYQTISDWGYYGVMIHLDGETDAAPGYEALVALHLEGQPIEIVLLDTSP